MSWHRVFKSQSYNQPTYKHKKLPIYTTKEFDFFRCVEFKNEFYGKTVSCLFEGNLRFSDQRYSALFPGQKISYWADSPETARAEIKKHGSGCDILTFWAYDDASSFLPCLGSKEPIVIVDGRKTGIQPLIDKINDNMELSSSEKLMIKEILEQPIDAIAYESKEYKGGENFIFLERGFRKLFLRELKLRFGRKSGGSHDSIVCSVSGDYVPFPEEYGKFFVPKCRIRMYEGYLKTDEYLERKKNMEKERDKKLGRIKSKKNKKTKTTIKRN